MDIKSIRGMKDILPTETPIWQWVEKVLRKATKNYGYKEIRLPILEPIELFQRAVGEATDIVSKEMYDFIDKSNEHITLRPEGTSGCVRSVIENNLCYNNTQRLWYQGPMFRYERPQKGRLRQFNQFGVKTFGMSNADIDSELIYLSNEIFSALGLTKYINLEINSLGTIEERLEHRKALINYFKKHQDLLDEDSLIRLEKNPLRILDSKNPQMQTMLENAPKLLDYLTGESLDHFKTVCSNLDQVDIKYTINPRLVRGLDYYTRTVFEWTTDQLGSQSTVCGGGRYDGLVALFSGQSLPASGFAIGIERLILLLEAVNITPPHDSSKKIIFTCEDKLDTNKALILAKNLRDTFPQLEVYSDFSGSKLKKQHQRALKESADIVVTLNVDHTLGIWSISDNDKLVINKEEFLDHIQIFIKE
ncbi:histidine--tRNA ligase [Photobacterium damselae]|uniref:histidine--tRNA ligase n=1 Tax=Photobacterium damselae TaxID=38293 RepID=UPI000D054860|nr:histidine--tRNA ligase [Photobacterium damselae]PSB84778.1 histidine--tRNA ligase [Photobacterium damselae subsp. damselae]